MEKPVFSGCALELSMSLIECDTQKELLGWKCNMKQSLTAEDICEDRPPAVCVSAHVLPKFPTNHIQKGVGDNQFCVI